MANKKAVLIVTLLLVIVTGLGTGGFLCVYSKTKEFDQVFMDGIYVEETAIGGLTKEEAKAQVDKMLKAREDAKSFLLYGDGKEWTIPSAKFKAEYNVDQVLDEAFEIGHEGNMFQRFRAFTNKEVTKKEFTLERSYKEEVAGQIIKEYEDAFYIAPKDASMVRKDRKFIISPEESGQKLDTEATAKKLNLAYNSQGDHKVEAVIVPVEAQIKVAYFESVQNPIASFYTSYSNVDLDRNTNLKVGAETINTSIGPGEVFALSDYLGIISAENGYKNSKVIVNGKLVDGIGGGICQVASTLYNSVLLTDLKVISRQNHSLPVGYIPLGRDATYASGAIDFKFENPTDHPVYIESYVENNRLYVNIFGHESLKPDHEVKFESVVMEVIPPPAPKYEEDPNLLIGKEVQELAPLDGKKVNLYRYIYKDGKLVDKILENKSYYRPRAGIIRVGTKQPPAEPGPVTPPVEPEPAKPKEVIDDPSLMDLYEEQA